MPKGSGGLKRLQTALSGSGKDKWYHQDDVDAITEIHNRLASAVGGKGPKFLGSIALKDMKGFNSQSFSNANAKQIIEIFGKTVNRGINITENGDYALIFNTGGHFFSVSVKKTGNNIEYTFYDSADKSYGEVKSLKSYIQHVQSIDTRHRTSELSYSKQAGEWGNVSLDELKTLIDQEKQRELEKFTNLSNNLEIFLKELFKCDSIIEKEREFSFLQRDINSCGSAAIMAAKAHCDPQMRSMLERNTNNGYFTPEFASVMVIEDMCTIYPDLALLKRSLEEQSSNLMLFSQSLLEKAGSNQITQQTFNKVLTDYKISNDALKDLMEDLNTEDIKELFTKIVGAYKGSLLGVSAPGVRESGNTIVRGSAQRSEAARSEAQGSNPQAIVKMEDAIGFCWWVRDIVVGGYTHYNGSTESFLDVRDKFNGTHIEIGGRKEPLSFLIANIGNYDHTLQEKIIKECIKIINLNTRIKDFINKFQSMQAYLDIPTNGIVRKQGGLSASRKYNEKEEQELKDFQLAQELSEKINGGRVSTKTATGVSSIAQSIYPWTRVDMPPAPQNQESLSIEEVGNLLRYIKKEMQNAQTIQEYGSFRTSMSRERTIGGQRMPLMDFLTPENMRKLDAAGKNQVIESVRNLLGDNPQVAVHLGGGDREVGGMLQKFINKKYDQITEQQGHRGPSQNYSAGQAPNPVHQPYPQPNMQGTTYPNIPHPPADPYQQLVVIIHQERPDPSWVTGKLRAIGNGFARFINGIKDFLGYGR